MSRGAEPNKVSRGARKQASTPMPSVNYTSSPLLTTRTPPWRVKLLTGIMGLAFAGLLGRAAWIQVINSDFYLAQGANRYERRIDLPPSRGLILDRHGELLASSVPAPSIWVIPKDMDATQEQRRQLAKLLDMTPQELKKRLSDNPNFVWLRRQADEQVAKGIAALNLKGVNQIKETRRLYPEGEAAAHIVGFTSLENRGLEGIELAYDSALSGRSGQQHVIKDRLGRVVDNVGETVLATDGKAIRLSIDAKVQANAYQRIRDAVSAQNAKAGSVVVLDAQTGEVLALANVPSYLPANRKNLTGAQLRNRALTDTFEPGSTMKPFVIAKALQSGLIQPNKVISTGAGSIQIDGSTITDSHPHGDLTVNEVVQKSSNVGTVRIAMMMTPKDLWDVYSAVGFGHKPQIGFPGAVTGRLRPYKSWRRIEHATMSYGYGLSASLMQIAQAYTVFAHDGEVLPVSLIKRELPSESTVTTSFGGVGNAMAAEPVREEVLPISGQRVFSPQVTQQVRKMLQMVCSEGGTAPLAQTVGYSVGGKTGTAHKQEGKGYAGNKYRSWFVGIAPIDKPRIVVAVMVDEPSKGEYFGGIVAAPVFSQVVQYTLNRLGVMPDLQVQRRVMNVPATVESY